MKCMKALMAILVAGVLASVGFAGPTATLLKNRDAAGKAVTPGRWHAGFKKCKAYAEANKVPLIAVWSNGDACGHCVMFEESVNHKTFTSWMKTSGCVFHFIYSGDHGDGDVGSSVFHWCRNNKNTSYPFVRIWWPAGKLDIATVGDTIDGAKSKGDGAKKAVAYFKSKLKKFNPTAAPKYTGGGFDMPESAQARLEAEVGLTTSVTVPLARTNNTVIAQASTNMVVATYPDGHSVTNTVEWAGGDSEASVDIDTSSLSNAGDQVTLTLLDNTGKEIATSHITAVKTENSPNNPLFVGEKTSDELDWGEWTMDLDAATNKVAAYNATASLSQGSVRRGAKPLSDSGKAHTLVLAGGSLWCPDCSAADHNFFSNTNFVNWAKKNKVALVAIDIPNLPDVITSPCLLTKVVYKTSDRYVTANYTPGYTNEDLRVQSGIGYLSRHMISDDKASEILARNIYLTAFNTLEGGWNRPERTNQDRIGVPTLLVLRDDGTVAGRFTRYSDVGPTAYESNVLKRLEELFDEADKDAEARAKDVEEANDSYKTTTETVGKRQKVENHTLSFTDAQDVYKLDDTTSGNLMNFTVTGEDDALVEVKVLNSNGAVVGQTNGTLTAGVALDCEIVSSNYYVQVGVHKTGGYPTAAFFSHTNANSTVAAYTLATDFVAVPKQTLQTATIEGEQAIMMAIVSNEVYRITGIDASAAAGVLEQVEGMADSFTARVTDTVKLTTTAASVDYQLWKPGTVGFATTSVVAAEPDKTESVSYQIRLVRKNGVSGTATAKVTFDAAKSSKLDQLVEIPDDFSDTITWNEGESDDRYLKLKILNNPFADGDQTLYFDLEAGGDATNGINRLRLTLRDNDPKRPGKVAIVSSDPEIAGDRTAYARAGSEMKINIGRVDGSDGDISATVSASAGTLDQTEFAWPRRNSNSQTATLTLPSAKGSTVTVLLTPAKGTAVDTNRRKISVKLLDENVPGFEESSVTIEAMRYVPLLPERRIALDAKADDSAKVKLVSGKLIAGLKWKFEDKKLVIYGTPTKAGSATARFRVYNGSTAGLATAVTVEVTDPVLAGGGGDGSMPLNAAVAKSRTFADIPVVDSLSNLVGVVTLTLPRSGRASAKYRMAEGTVSLSCESWTGLNTTEGTLLASLTGKFKGEEFAIHLDAFADGSVTMTIDDPMHNSLGSVQCLTEGNLWSKANPATDFKGYYTVSMPIYRSDLYDNLLAKGDSYVTLKMNTATAINAGKFAFAGVYPNGKPFSGSAVLTALDLNEESTNKYWRTGVLPLILSSDSDSLAGALKITPGAADPAASETDAEGNLCKGRCSYKVIRRSVHPLSMLGILWSHAEKAEKVSCDVVALDAYGTYYVSTENFAECCKAALSTDKLSFFSVGGLDTGLEEEVMEGLNAGDFKDGGKLTIAEKTVNVTYTPKTKKKAATNTIKFVPAKDKKGKAINPNGLTLTFTLSTGLVTGSFKLPRTDGGTTTFTYKGVVVPGWGSEECTDCGMGGSEAKLRPFISGTAWFNDTLTYTDAKGKDRDITVRRSLPFSVGVESGN